ncbi:glycosyltransferase family 2 protein [Hymenobacter coccineus]|uniref:Glycosyltransferase 2-like domain-containing protein n=1 Tax=Hymenobacter coccineus TaxID=1908235 RepID=A0A1G1TJP5_9BACT|nr:glycosyltransferase family 2 protein [Hymenobacter coccineus]OGX91079.1 hypothetical protein BEN49_05405 [Hymenobacter coccineus]
MSPKVTVIIPNYNHARYLPQRIESVLNQTFQDIEVILMDDCSPDNSRNIIEHYAVQNERIHVVFNEQNSGSTFKQWNKGFSLAKGEYIWIAESDDYADTNFLETLVKQLDQDPRIGLAYCDSNTVDENNAPINALNNFYSELDPVLWTQDFVVDGRELITGFMSYRNIIPNASAVVIRKSVIDKVGKADEKFKINGDWVFWAAIIADVKVAFVAEKLNYFRFHLNNVRSKTLAKGVALSERSTVLRAMQKYGKGNGKFFDIAVNDLVNTWFSEMILNNIPLKTHMKIFSNLKKVNTKFSKDFLTCLNKYFISNNLSGLRQFLGDGLLYKVLRK